MNHHPPLTRNRPLLAARTKACAAALLLAASSLVVSASGIAPASPATSQQPAGVVVSTGLKNLGNTCYLNAQLQCAFHIPKVRDLILAEPPKPTKVEQQQPVDDEEEATAESVEAKMDDDDETSGETVSTPDEDPAVDTTDRQQEPEPAPESPGLQALRIVFGDMLQQSSQQQQQYAQPVIPRILCATLGIPVLEQQDSQEFWKLLLPALQLPALTELYQGSLEDYIVALDGSGRERRREEAFLDLSLDLVISPSSSSSSDTTSTVASLKRMFGTPELLSVKEGNGWRPENGADKVDAHKGSQLYTHGLPSILQLHLKRFNFEWNRNVMEKLNNPFSFPLELDVSSIVCHQTEKATTTTTTVTPEEEDTSSSTQQQTADGEEADTNKSDTTYDLQSVLVHAGEFGVGHYYAYVRPDIRKNTWYRMNDDVVTPVSYQEVIIDATGGKVNPHQVLSSDTEAPTEMESKKRNGLSWLVGPLKKLFQKGPARGGPSFGFGGRTSNAYVLQYVRRSQVPVLYNEEEKAPSSEER